MLVKDLEQYRKDGYIELPALKIKEFESSISKLQLEDDVIYFKTMWNNSYTHFTEVLISIIARQIGISAVKYDLAIYKGKYGTISYNFENKEFKGLDYNNFLYSHLPSNMKKEDVCIAILSTKKILVDKIKMELLSKKDANQILKDQIQLAIFDTFTMNTDRFSRNITILSNQKQFKLSPIYDNEICFLSNYAPTKIDNILSGTEVKATIKSLVYKTNTVLTILNSTKCDNSYFENLKSIKQLYPDLFEKTLEKINKINIKLALTRMEEEQKIMLPENYKKWITVIFQTRKNAITNYLENTKLRTAKEDYEIK